MRLLNGQAGQASSQATRRAPTGDFRDEWSSSGDEPAIDKSDLDDTKQVTDKGAGHCEMPQKVDPLGAFSRRGEKVRSHGEDSESSDAIEESRRKSRRTREEHEHDERAEARRRHQREERSADHRVPRHEEIRARHLGRAKGKGKRGQHMQKSWVPVQTVNEAAHPGWKVFIGDLPSDMDKDSSGKRNQLGSCVGHPYPGRSPTELGDGLDPPPWVTPVHHSISWAFGL